jgi:hypothetical protein
MSISYLKQIEKLQADVAHLKQAASAALELVDIVAAERDVLAAHNEELQKVPRRLVSVEHEYGGSLQLNGQFAYKVPESIFKSAKQALNTTPAACLAQVRAEAVSEFAEFLFVKKGLNIKDVANQYAESIRQEVK